MSSLNFSVNLPNAASSGLQLGTLVLEVGGASITFQATSGLPGSQFEGSWDRKGKGPLPPSSKISSAYTVSTRPVTVNTPGVNGAFFPIAPFVVAINGIERGDFGIHFDANVPGSSGCIVLPKQSDWLSFQQEMVKLQSSGVKAVSLTVIYT